MGEGQLEGLGEGNIGAMGEGQLDGMGEGDIGGLGEGELEGMGEGDIGGMRETQFGGMGKGNRKYILENKTILMASKYTDQLLIYIHDVDCE